MGLTDEWAVLGFPLARGGTYPGSRTGTSLEKSPRGAQRYLVGAAHRCAVAGLAEAISAYQTRHRRFQRWLGTGVMEAIPRALAEDLQVRGNLDLQACFIGGTFGVAKKGATGWERPGGAKVRSS